METTVIRKPRAHSIEQPEKSVRGVLCRIGRDLIILFFLLVNLFPLFWVVMSSFKTNREILDYALSLPSTFSFKNYVRVFEEPNMLMSFLNSGITVVVSVAINTCACYMAAYAINRYRFRWLTVLLTVVSFGLLIPINSALLPIKLVMDKLALTNSVLGLSVLYSAIQIPMSVMILQGHVAGIPREIDEAASIDGASPWLIAIRIVAPIAQPGLVTVVILQAVYSWNDFLYAMTLISDQGRKTVQVITRNFLGLFQSNYGALFASVVLAIIPMVVVFILFQNSVIEAFTAGSVKQ